MQEGESAAEWQAIQAAVARLGPAAEEVRVLVPPTHNLLATPTLPHIFTSRPSSPLLVDGVGGRSTPPPPSHPPSHSQIAAELDALPCLLLMEFVRGKPLLECADAFEVRYMRSRQGVPSSLAFPACERHAPQSSLWGARLPAMPQAAHSDACCLPSSSCAPSPHSARPPLFPLRAHIYLPCLRT